MYWREFPQFGLMGGGVETPGSGEPESAEESASTAGRKVYSPLLKEQLAEERSRKTSIEQRGVAVITTSGVLVSLLFGLAAVVTQAKSFELLAASRALLAVSLLLFVVAALGGIVSNWPLSYSQFHVEDLRRFVDAEYWGGPVDTASRRVAEAQVQILKRARRLNAIKGRALLFAMLIQVLAVVALATSVTTMLLK